MKNFKFRRASWLSLYTYVMSVRLSASITSGAVS